MFGNCKIMCFETAILFIDVREDIEFVGNLGIFSKNEIKHETKHYSGKFFNFNSFDEIVKIPETKSFLVQANVLDGFNVIPERSFQLRYDAELEADNMKTR